MLPVTFNPANVAATLWHGVACAPAASAVATANGRTQGNGNNAAGMPG